MNDRIVARYADGRILKGSTADFVPTRDSFHLSEAGTPPGTPPLRVRLAELKAVFFVKDFAGNPSHRPRDVFEGNVAGRKVKVVFKDGETLVGTTQGYQPDRPGFFLLPADPDANSERCYIVAAATASVTLI